MTVLKGRRKKGRRLKGYLMDIKKEVEKTAPKERFFIRLLKYVVLVALVIWFYFQDYYVFDFKGKDLEPVHWLMIFFVGIFLIYAIYNYILIHRTQKTLEEMDKSDKEKLNDE
ncbi:MAG: hypothetical protein ACYTFY_10355 [Planctomycetota bacterium]|jgi:amino acid permease